jgi:hypothetical protein
MNMNLWNLAPSGLSVISGNTLNSIDTTTAATVACPVTSGVE